MNCDNSEEVFPVVDSAGKVVGRATRGECHGGSMLLHPVVHLHVFNSRGELYLQKRPLWKDIQPGRWDTAVGGHVDYGETIAEALFRSERERELVHVFRAVCDGPVRPSGELDGGRFWSPQEIRENLGEGIFTPNFEGEVKLVLG